MEFGEYPMAARMRDAIAKIAEKAVESKRPPPRYATVVSLAGTTANNLWVRFLDEEEDQLVALASIRPSRSGQIVRIEGTIGDRYVADVLGEAVVVGGGVPLGAMYRWPGITPPAGSMKCDGTQLAVDQYPEAFAILGYRFGGSGNVFALPSETDPNANVMVVIRVL
jgi:hypothetical protein